MKNTFAVTMTLLLALTLGGSFAGYRIATASHHAEGAAEGEAKGAAGAQGEQGNVPGQVKSEEAPSAQRASTGSDTQGQTTGNVRQQETGGTQSGENGVVINSGGADPSGRTSNEGSDATDGTNNAGSGTASIDNTAGATGNTNANRAAAGEDNNDASAQGDAAAGEAKFAANCAACHGQGGVGGGVGPAINTPDGPKAWSLEEFTLTLREGRTPTKTLNAVMPRYVATQITDQEIANLHAYIKGL
ncbi:Cytochrome C oxidase, cbb3-type, subunit III [Deinococcus reticulitermitis]|uniref:Cytochrome C oxidase, cbb3-type, subunit III n=1 Tax=Deinococcus reticulitermitis TaxID=856736 RepID=A0A1H7B792_9DEIO|nr:c-type cytochrome [Deinococcus reticulitermitis]SEJ73026.1 Cytochrome C oxidase, cbb3-type, subunit III [Deinococcus reticulitermitis]